MKKFRIIKITHESGEIYHYVQVTRNNGKLWKYCNWQGGATRRPVQGFTELSYAQGLLEAERGLPDKVISRDVIQAD